MSEFDFIEDTLTNKKENKESNINANYMESILTRKKEENNSNGINNETKQNKPKVSNVNKERFAQEVKQNKKFKVKGSWQTKVVVGTITVAIILGVGTIMLEKFTKPYHLPDNYKEVVYTENIERNDTVYSVIDDYYKDNKEYKGLYNNERGYQKEVLELNNLSKPDTVNYYGELDIPVVLDVNSGQYRLYEHINTLKKEKQSKFYFVDYVVKSGDNISYLATLSAFDNNELIDFTNKILSINGLKKGDILTPGTTIKIINPELQGISQKLNSAIEQFESLVKNEAKTK